MLDACDGAVAHGAHRGRADRGRAAGRPREGGPRAGRPDRRGLRPHRGRGRGARARRRRRAHRLRGHASRATRGRAASCAPPWSRSRTESCTDGSPARVVREGLLPRPRRGGHGHRQGDQERVPEAVARSTTPTPTPATPPPRSASRRCRPPTTWSATPSKRKEYDEVRRLGPAAAGFPGGGGGGAGGFRLPGRRRPRRPARRAVRSAAAAAGAGRAAAARTAARTSRPSCTSPSTTPSPGVTTAVHLTSDAPCHTCNGSGAKPGTVPHTLCATAAARAWCPTTRASSRFSSPCPVCGGRGVTIDDPCPTCRGTGRGAPAPRGEGAGAGGRRRRPAHPAQGPRRSGPATAARPATSTSSSACRRHPLFRPQGHATSPSPSRSPSPRRPSAPTSPCPPSTARSVHHPGARRAPARAAPSGSRARAWSPPKGTGDLLVTVEVAVPSKLSSAERKALEAFQAASDGASPREHLGV